MYFIKFISELAFICAIFCTIIFIESLFKHKTKSNSEKFYIIWCIAFLLCLPHLPRVFGYKTTQIGSFYEAREYTEKYYVVMSKKPKDISNRKQYTLPAEIKRLETYAATISHSDYGDNEYEEDIYAPHYFINYLYFNNGGYLYFGDNEDNPPVVVNKEVEVLDYHGDTYYITLTDRKAEKNKKVAEINLLPFLRFEGTPANFV